MCLITLFLVSINYLVFTVSYNNNFNISGICGYPGIPLSSQHNVGNEKYFNSGHIVNYQCVDFLGYKQERTCLNGQWVGPQARCGYAKHNDLNRIVVRDCSRSRIIANFEQIEMGKNFDRIVNSFSTERYDEQPIRVPNSTCLRWHLYLTNRSHFQFVRTDFSTVFKGVSKSHKEVPVVTAFIPNTANKCQMEAMKQYKHIFTNKWINYGYKYHFYISCQINNSTESQNELIIETETKIATTLDLVRFSVAEVYGSALDPACGIPEIAVGVKANKMREYQLYEMVCDEPFFTNSTNVVRTQMMCTSNAIWSGSYPKCKPRMSCADTHSFKPDSIAPIDSIENAFFYNKTLWFAINGTVINYRCGGQTCDLLDIKSKKCMTNGLWDREESVCNQMNADKNEWSVKSAQTSREPIRELIIKHLMPVYAMVAFTSLIVIMIAITALVIIWKKSETQVYKDPIEVNPPQTDYKQYKERPSEVVGWKDRPITANTYVDENQSIYRKQYEYQSDAIYDVPPNNSNAIPIIISSNRETELDQNLLFEPIYDQPKRRHPNSDQ